MTRPAPLHPASTVDQLAAVLRERILDGDLEPGRRLIAAGSAPEGVMAAGFGGAAVLLVPVLALAGPGFLTSAGGLGLAVYLGAIPTALAYVLFSRGLRSLTSGETATLVLAEPLTAAALGIAALGEQPSAAAGIGAGLVLAGLAVLAAPARSRLRTSKPAAATA